MVGAYKDMVSYKARACEWGPTLPRLHTNQQFSIQSLSVSQSGSLFVHAHPLYNFLTANICGLALELKDSL